MPVTKALESVFLLVQVTPLFLKAAFELLFLCL